jgi:hypothetical protein
LGITVFVRHLVDLVKQVLTVCPQGRLREIETAMVISILVCYYQQKKNAFRCSFSLHRIYMSHKAYRGQKSALSKVPIHASTRVPLAMQTLLVASLTDGFSFKITSLQLVEENKLPKSQGKRAE